MAEIQAEEVEQQSEKKVQGKLGELLKSYREQSGHDIEEVAEALCLSPEIVRALEAENFDVLPEPPYIRGYLRSYAKFAEVDSEEIIKLYETQRGATPQDLEYHFKPNTNDIAKPPISATTLRLGLTALLLIVLGSLSMIPAVNSWIGDTWTGFSKQTAENNQRKKIEEGEEKLVTNKIEPPAPLPGDEKEDLSKDKGKEAANEKADATSLAKNGTEKTEATDNKDNPDQVDEKNNPDKTDENNAKPEGKKLRFVFKKEVWMRIKDKKKKVVFEALSPGGTEKELRLKTPLTFRIGNPQGIEIYVGGKRLDISNFIVGSVSTFTIK